MGILGECRSIHSNRKEREREKERRGSDERGRRGRSSETCHNDKPGL